MKIQKNYYKTVERPHGQIIILFAIALIALIGFVALAVDGGLIFADRRTDQNAADSSALAGAGKAAMYMQSPSGGEDPVIDTNFSCSLPAVIAAKNLAYSPAVARAAANGFTIDNEDANGDGNGVFVLCNQAKKRIEVRVNINKKVQTSFVHLFIGGDVNNTVTTTAIAEPQTSFTMGNAIASLSDKCQKPNGTTVNLATDGGIWFEGGGGKKIDIWDGGIFSNTCMNSDGGTYVETHSNSGGPKPPIDYVTTLDNNGNSSVFIPTPTQVDTPLTIRTINITGCGPVQTHDWKKDYDKKTGILTIQPGTYNAPVSGPDKGVAISGGGSGTKLIMQYGLYCLNGDFVAPSGSWIQVQGYPLPLPPTTHDGVTIFLESGKIDFGGNPTVNLQGCTMKEKVNCAGGAYPGLLMYVPPSNVSLVNIGGNPASIYEGSIYAPKSWIDMGGNPSTESNYATEIVGWVIVLHGNVSINITYNSSTLYHSPTLISLLKGS